MHRARLLALAAVALASSISSGSAFADDAPRIRSVTPPSALRGQVVDVAIEGVNLYPNEDVLTTRSEIGLVVVGTSTATKVTVRLTVGESAAPGPVPITIKTKSGVVTTEKFQVKLRAPTVVKVRPDVLPRGGEYDLVVTGTNLVLAGADTLVSVAEPLTTKTLGKPTDKEFKLHVVVPVDATIGPKSLTFETGDGKISTMLVVALAPPVIAKPRSVSVDRGGSVSVSLEGKSLAASQGVVLAIPDREITIAADGPPTATAIPLKISASDKAAAGVRLLVVPSPDGFVTLPLEVRATAPALSAPEPAGVTRGSKVDVALAFAPLPPKASFDVAVFPPGTGVAVKAKSAGVFTLDVEAGALPGPRTLIASHPWGVAMRPFLIGTKPPSVTGITPSEVAPGASADLAIEGRNLEGATISLPVADPALELTPAEKGLSAKLVVKADAKPGPRAIAVRTADGVALGFLSIKGGGASAPSITSALPTRLLRGAATKVVIAGANLRGAEGAPTIAARDAAGGAIPVQLGAASATSVEVTLDLAAGAPIGGAIVTLATNDGATATGLLVLPASPTIQSVDPASIARGGVRDVTIVGTGLVAPGGAAPTISLQALGDTTSLAPKIESATAERIVLKVDARALAKTGPYVLSLSHADGGAATMLSVDAAPPAVDSVAPVVVGTPAAVELTVTGRNLIGSDGKPAGVQVTRIGASASLAPLVVKSSPTSLTVRVTTTITSSPGPHVLIVKTVDGESAGLFTVVAIPPPVIQRLAPAKAPRNGGVLAAVTGTGLLGVTAVEFSGKGVTAAVLPGGKDTELLLRITVAADAEPGDHTFVVTGPGGQAASGSTVLTVE